LLDNFFVVVQAIRQVREDMPTGYYQQLPKLQNTALKHYPRIYALAHETVGYSNRQITIGDTAQFVQAFQADGVVLTIGELWAFPTMLRLSILESLTEALTAQIAAERAAEAPSARVTAALYDDNTVGNCITNLRILAIQDWKSFFESVSVVEAILRSDPAGGYPTMDFDTRNTYRTAIETLARQTRHTEDT